MVAKLFYNSITLSYFKFLDRMSGLDEMQMGVFLSGAYANILHFPYVTGMEGMNELLYCDS